MKKSSIFWGVALVLMAALVIVSEMGWIQGVGFWTIMFTVVFAAWLISGIVKFSISRILFSIAFLCIIWDDVLGIQNITPWPVLFAALLGSIGFSLIFKNKKKIYYKSKYSSDTVDIDVDLSNGAQHAKSTVEMDDGEEVECSARFSSSVKYINSEDLRSVDVKCSFGSVTVYLDNAKVYGDNVIVNIDVSFSGVELYIPKDWSITNHIETSFAGVDVEGQGNGLNAVNVILVGTASFSGINIIYV